MWFARTCFILMGFAFVWWPVREMIRAIRTGALRTRSGFLVSRAKKPMSFWAGFAIYAFTVLMGLVLLILGIFAPLDKQS
jgi:hypothetical protein